MNTKKELGLLIVKYPYAGKQEDTRRILEFTNKKFLEQLGQKPQIIYEKLIENGTEFLENIYSHLRGKWEHLSEMLTDFKSKPIHPFILRGHLGTTNLLKRIAGVTENEKNPDTIRGMMRNLYGDPNKEWFNSIHIPHPKEIGRDLQILKKFGFFPKKIMEDYLE